MQKRLTFNERKYTQDAIIKELILIEKHSKDGSAVEGGCACIESKHLYALEGLAEEGKGFSLSAKEKEFYSQLGDLARLVRKNMEVENYELHGVMRSVMSKAGVKTPFSSYSVKSNPGPRLYLPYGLTSCEKQYSSVQKKLSRCIKKLEPRERKGEIESAVAVCRASIKCPP